MVATYILATTPLAHILLAIVNNNAQDMFPPGALGASEKDTAHVVVDCCDAHKFIRAGTVDDAFVQYQLKPTYIASVFVPVTIIDEGKPRSSTQSMTRVSLFCHRRHFSTVGVALMYFAWPRSSVGSRE